MGIGRGKNSSGEKGSQMKESPFHIGQRLFCQNSIYRGAVVKVEVDPAQSLFIATTNTGWWLTTKELENAHGYIGLRNSATYASTTKRPSPDFFNDEEWAAYVAAGWYGCE